MHEGPSSSLSLSLVFLDAMVMVVGDVATCVGTPVLVSLKSIVHSHDWKPRTSQSQVLRRRNMMTIRSMGIGSVVKECWTASGLAT